MNRAGSRPRGSSPRRTDARTVGVGRGARRNANAGGEEEEEEEDAARGGRRGDDERDATRARPRSGRPPSRATTRASDRASGPPADGAVSAVPGGVMRCEDDGARRRPPRRKKCASPEENIRVTRRFATASANPRVPPSRILLPDPMMARDAFCQNAWRRTSRRARRRPASPRTSPPSARSRAPRVSRPAPRVRAEFARARRRVARAEGGGSFSRGRSS